MLQGDDGVLQAQKPPTAPMIRLFEGDGVPTAVHAGEELRVLLAVRAMQFDVQVAERDLAICKQVAEQRPLSILNVHLEEVNGSVLMVQHFHDFTQAHDGPLVPLHELGQIARGPALDPNLVEVDVHRREGLLDPGLPCILATGVKHVDLGVREPFADVHLPADIPIRAKAVHQRLGVLFKHLQPAHLLGAIAKVLDWNALQILARPLGPPRVVRVPQPQGQRDWVLVRIHSARVAGINSLPLPMPSVLIAACVIIVEVLAVGRGGTLNLGRSHTSPAGGFPGG